MDNHAEAERWAAILGPLHANSRRACFGVKCWCLFYKMESQ